MKTRRLLILDDDAAFRTTLRAALSAVFLIDEAADEAGFRAAYQPMRYELLLLDMRLHDKREGIELLQHVFSSDPLQPVIMLSGFGNADAAIEAVNAGAMMFLHKQDFTPGQLIRMAEAVIEQGRLRRLTQTLRDLVWRDQPDYLVGNSTGIQIAREKVLGIAQKSSITPLILGESGSGTTLLSRLIHRAGKNFNGPLVELDSKQICSKGDDWNLANVKNSQSWIKAQDGTLVIDHLPSPGRSTKWQYQTSQLDRTFMNDRSPRLVLISKLHKREVTTESEPIDQLMEQLNSVYLPPLRQRSEDIPILAYHFIYQQQKLHQSQVCAFAPEVLDWLQKQEWIGNVRELRNLVEYSTLRAEHDRTTVIEQKHLPQFFTNDNPIKDRHPTWDYRFQTARAEVQLVDQAVAQGIHSKTALAESLGYSDRFTLLRRIRKALLDYPALSCDYPIVASLFQPKRSE